MSVWDTVLGQRALESINSISQDIDKIKKNQPTLRDYFAAMFMSGYCSEGIYLDANFKLVAEGAYRMADAMLEVRKEK